MRWPEEQERLENEVHKSGKKTREVRPKENTTKVISEVMSGHLWPLPARGILQ